MPIHDCHVSFVPQDSNIRGVSTKLAGRVVHTCLDMLKSIPLYTGQVIRDTSNITAQRTCANSAIVARTGSNATTTRRNTTLQDPKSYYVQKTAQTRLSSRKRGDIRVEKREHRGGSACSVGPVNAAWLNRRDKKRDNDSGVRRQDCIIAFEGGLSCAAEPRHV